MLDKACADLGAEYIDHVRSSLASALRGMTWPCFWVRFDGHRSKSVILSGSSLQTEGEANQNVV